MTKTWYKFLIDGVKNQLIVPPDDVTVEQMTSWLLGYKAYQGQIIDLIKDIAKGTDNGRD